MYTQTNFKTKKALKEALARGEEIRYFQPNQIFPGPITQDGRITLEGPHYPQPHKWYAEATVRNGLVISVK